MAHIFYQAVLLKDITSPRGTDDAMSMPAGTKIITRRRRDGRLCISDGICRYAWIDRDQGPEYIKPVLNDKGKPLRAPTWLSEIWSNHHAFAWFD